ncbi:exported hypothetical protein [Xanthomonas citri pv. citri]|uniref:Uncharacterized protein n=1 Tax=Xanthomonas citri pv. citri TaxID=611301 RepID=A0A0U5FCZ7_XANCI|nr:exported hypothetical protein [Xanthomonas citri pv. citri]CEJ43089.1 exported hypothetical protein [Xanthomonas citri pv. bilvae]CEE24027.1 exported hypothetical protein [Xanthomonas citri pv. citri]CEE36637.1 exported hypothetical protein [Xanthomonas citri pv. citri]CEE36832.1 exported hypothetical protein [Xanthomonas citri pv. citri]
MLQRRDVAAALVSMLDHADTAPCRCIKSKVTSNRLVRLDAWREVPQDWVMSGIARPLIHPSERLLPVGEGH